MLPKPITFAHRGASAYAPENTLSAFCLALEQGASGLESDAWLSRDGVPVLVHDEMVAIQGRQAPVWQIDCAALQAAGIPTLAELYQACGADFEFSLDLQQPKKPVPQDAFTALDSAREILRVAGSAGATIRLWLCHDSLDLLKQVREENQDVRLVDSVRRRKLGESVAQRSRRLAGLGIDALNMPWYDWTPRLVRRVQAAGVKAFAWDAHDAEFIDLMLNYGADAIYSNFPDVLAGRAKQKGLE